MGGRGVCSAQTCTDARSAHKTAHIGTTRPTPRSKQLRRCAFLTCAVVQPSTLRTQAALGSGFALQAAFWYQNAIQSHLPPKGHGNGFFGKYRHAGKASSFPARRKAVQIRRDLRPSEAAARWQDCLDPAGFSNGFVKFIEKCGAGRKGLKSRVNSCILKIKITVGPDRWSAGVMDGSKREGVIKKSRKVNTEERDLVGRTAAHGAHQQTIR